MQDLVSVIIPTYNRENTIKESVESVLSQTYSNIEVIVVDDGSTDNTQKILQNIKDPRLQVVYQKNQGACAARNNGIRHAQGKFISFNDSDDIWLKDKLEYQMRIMNNKHPDISFCQINMKKGPTFKKVDVGYKEGFLNPVTNLLGITTQTLLFKSDVLKNNMFDVSMPRYQEFELLLRLADKYHIYCLDKGLVNKNISSDAISVNHQKLIKAIKIILQKNPDLSIKYPIIYSGLENNIFVEAKMCLKEGDWRQAQWLMNNSLRFKENLGIKSLKFVRNEVLIAATPLIKFIYKERK